MENLDRFTTIVPFKMNVWEGMTHTKSGMTIFETNFPELNRYLKFLRFGKSFGRATFEHNGWEQNDNLAPPQRGIYVDTLKNGIYRVHYVNESPDPCSGHEKTCFFSKKLEALEKFCDDWKFNKDINVLDDVEHYF